MPNLTMIYAANAGDPQRYGSQTPVHTITPMVVVTQPSYTGRVIRPRDNLPARRGDRRDDPHDDRTGLPPEAARHSPILELNARHEHSPQPRRQPEAEGSKP